MSATFLNSMSIIVLVIATITNSIVAMKTTRRLNERIERLNREIMR